MNSTSKDLTATEVKLELHCANSTFWSLLNQKEIEAYYVGNQLRIPRESLEEFKKRNKFVPKKSRASK